MKVLGNVGVLEKYVAKMGVRETEVAIKQLKDFFERRLAETLTLTRVSAPLFVLKETGLNDNLNGVETPVGFEIEGRGRVEIVHSLAKWKRMALYKYGFTVGEGLYTDMNAIRKDEELSPLHSLYVDQWDWEKIIDRADRNSEFLKKVVRKIYQVFKDTEAYIASLYPKLEPSLPEEIYFITTQELEDLYPGLTPKERENAIAREKGAIFLMQIGGDLRSGTKHDGRSPDYDDWRLNGDIIFWYPTLEMAVELSSMGIRVDEEALERQLKIAGCEERRQLPFHQLLLAKELPYTIGGGIGQSRICMFFLQKAHIGEVQASIWPEEMHQACIQVGIQLL